FRRAAGTSPWSLLLPSRRKHTILDGRRSCSATTPPHRRGGAPAGPRGPRTRGSRGRRDAATASAPPPPPPAAPAGRAPAAGGPSSLRGARSGGGTDKLAGWRVGAGVRWRHVAPAPPCSGHQLEPRRLPLLPDAVGAELAVLPGGEQMATGAR